LITVAIVVGVGLFVPAVDSPSFGNTPKYEVALRPSSIGGEATPFVVSLTFSPETRIDSDSVLMVSRSDTEPRALPDARIVADSGAELSIRATLSCGTKGAPQMPGQNSVCSLANASNGTSAAKWIYRASKPGDYLITLSISEFLIDSDFKSAVSRWQATLTRDGDAIERYIHGRDGRDWHGGEDRSDLKRIPYVLDSARPRFKDERFELDLANGQIEIRISAQSTLGVSSTIYQYLSVAATALSAALGGGWIWQFITYLRSRKKPPSAHVPLVRRKKGARE